jgi:predicted DNA-binding transcriptional regulator AlpA
LIGDAVSTALVPDAANQPTMQVDDVEKALGLSRAAAYNGVQTGEIPSIRIGRRIVVPTAAVRKMLLLDAGTDA